MSPEKVIEFAQKSGFYFGEHIISLNSFALQHFTQLVRNAALEEAADSLYGNGLEMSLLRNLHEEIRSLKS